MADGSQRRIALFIDVKAEHLHLLHVPQVHSLLSPGGHFCVISYEPPAGRGWLFQGQLGEQQGSQNGEHQALERVGATEGSGDEPIAVFSVSSGVHSEAAGDGTDMKDAHVLQQGQGYGRVSLKDEVHHHLNGGARWRVLSCGFEHQETGNYIYVLKKC